MTKARMSSTIQVWLLAVLFGFHSGFHSDKLAPGTVWNKMPFVVCNSFETLLRTFFDGLCVYPCTHAHMPSWKRKVGLWLPELKPNLRLSLENPSLASPLTRDNQFIVSLSRIWTHAKVHNQTLILLSFFVFSVQKLQTFQSLSCPGFSASDGIQSGLASSTSNQPDSDFTAVPELEAEAPLDVGIDDEEEDLSFEELDSDSACSVDSRHGSPESVMDGKRALWKGDCGTQRDIFQLGGELDLDQIERNWTFSRRFIEIRDCCRMFLDIDDVQRDEY